VDIFPNGAAVTRLVGTMMREQNEKWPLNLRCMQPEGRPAAAQGSLPAAQHLPRAQRSHPSSGVPDGPELPRAQTPNADAPHVPATWPSRAAMASDQGAAFMKPAQPPEFDPDEPFWAAPSNHPQQADGPSQGHLRFIPSVRSLKSRHVASEYRRIHTGVHIASSLRPDGASEGGSGCSAYRPRTMRIGCPRQKKRPRAALPSRAFSLSVPNLSKLLKYQSIHQVFTTGQSWGNSN